MKKLTIEDLIHFDASTKHIKELAVKAKTYDELVKIMTENGFALSWHKLQEIRELFVVKEVKADLAETK